MKLIVLILTTAILQVSANTYAQKVTLSEKNAPLTKIFNQISQQSGFDFLVTKSVLDNAKPVTIKVTNAELKDVLNQIFQNQPLEYEITDKSVLVREKAPTILDKLKSALSIPVTVTGNVLDETGQPMPGVTVKQKGTNNTAVTDNKGSFSISVPDNNSIIVFSYIGYEPQELAAKEIQNGSVITLKATQTNLREVVVNKGYYNTTNRLNTGNVTTVKGDLIAEQPLSNPILALEGLVPGMDIRQPSGAPGKVISVAIRGKNSLTQGSDPLYIIDGVPMFQLPTGGTTFDDPNLPSTLGISSSPMNSINPADIESISVLKDADATAIYGTRGANGVILITTKRGKNGPLKMDASIYQGYGQATKLVKSLNTSQYLQMRHEAFKNDNVAIPGNAYDVNGSWDTTRYTDWEKKIYGGTAHYDDAQASIFGGSTLTQYRIAFGYHRESTIFPGDFSDQRASFSANLNNSSADNKIKSNFSISYSNERNILPTVLFTTIALLPPDAPPIYDATGNLNWQKSTFVNPYSYLYKSGRSSRAFLNGNYNISYEILPGLLVKSNFGYSTNQVDQYQKTPLTSYNPAQTFQRASASSASNAAKSWIIEPQLTYRRTVGRGTLDVLAGLTFQQQSQQDMAIQGTGFTDDALLGSIAAASTVTVLGTASSEYKYDSGYARLGYNYHDQYIVNVTGRRDGSSRFGPGRQFGNFGSLGAAWIFSNTKFAEEGLPFLSFGKLRASYGLTGNDQIGDYGYLSQYVPQNNTTYFGSATLLAQGLPNPSYGWEKTRKFESALVLGFLKDRITTDISYYLNNSSNVLIPYPLPAFTGGTSITANSKAHLRNSGIEMTLTTRNITAKNWTWTTSVTLTVPINDATLVSYPDLGNSSLSDYYIVGKSINIVKTLKSTGVNPGTGLYTFQDIDKDGQISYPNDYSKVIYLGKQYYGGMLNSMRYKNFQLDFLFQFSRQNHASNILGGLGRPGTMRNIPQYVYDNAWKKPGDQATIQRFSNSNALASQAFGNFVSSDAVYTTASFLRLRNLSFSYNIAPEKWRNLNIRGLKLFIQAQNLFVITNYLGIDPETQSPYGTPPLKVITAGAQINL